MGDVHREKPGSPTACGEDEVQFLGLPQSGEFFGRQPLYEQSSLGLFP